MKLLVIAIIVINVLFSLKGFKDQAFFNQYKFSVAAIHRKEWYRMISSGFLHVDFWHLGFNMYALYLFSNAILNQSSNFTYLLIYTASLLAGNYLSFYKYKSNGYYSAVGASGAVSGIIYASILIYPDMSLYILPFPFPIKGYIFGIGYLMYSIYGMKKQIGNTGHTAHIGGAIAGYVLAILLFPNVLQYARKEAFFIALPILFLFVAEKQNWLK